MRSIRNDRLRLRAPAPRIDLLADRQSGQMPIMQPTKASRWFIPIVIAAAVVAGVTVMSSVWVEAQRVPIEAGVVQLFAPQAGETQRAAAVVRIEPSHIEVVGKRRAPSVLDVLAGWLPHGGGAS